MQSKNVRKAPHVLDFMTSMAMAIVFISALMGQKLNLPVAVPLCTLRQQMYNPNNADFYIICTTSLVFKIVIGTVNTL